MANFTDKQYYARTEGRIDIFRLNEAGTGIGEIVAIPQAYFVGDIISTPNTDPGTGIMFDTYLTAIVATTPGAAFDAAQWETIERPVEGNNRFLSLEDVINNYVVLYSDDMNHTGMAKRMKVEAFAKRAIQEFSYDTLRIQDLEYEITDNTRMVMPQDFVELVNMVWVDRNGKEQWMVQRLDSSNPRSPLQDDEGNYVYNSDGNLVVGYDTSITDTRWNDNSNNREQSGGTEFRTEGGYYTYGKRYYLDTETTNRQPTYYINERDGVIDFDASILGPQQDQNGDMIASIIIMKYISDGMAEDPADIQVHKFAEQAIYDTIYFEMITRSALIPANEKERAKRRMVAKKREAKLRLSKISPRELIQTFRAQSGWIKT